MKRLMNMGLEAKINGILIGIITSIVVIISVFVLYDSTSEYYDNAERLSLQSAKTISFLPSLVNKQGLAEEAVQSIANQYIFENDIDFVIIKDSDGTIVTHPIPEFIGEYEAYDEKKPRISFNDVLKNMPPVKIIIPLYIKSGFISKFLYAN